MASGDVGNKVSGPLERFRCELLVSIDALERYGRLFDRYCHFRTPFLSLTNIAINSTSPIAMRQRTVNFPSKEA